MLIRGYKSELCEDGVVGVAVDVGGRSGVVANWWRECCRRWKSQLPVRFIVGDVSFLSWCVIGVGADVGCGSLCVGGGRRDMLQGTCEVDGRLHLAWVVICNRRSECMLKAGDEEVDLMKLTGDADM